MNLREDIKYKIDIDFPGKKENILAVLQPCILKLNVIEPDRIIRCILFLAEKDLEKLKHWVEVAKTDPRDLLLAAEYIDQGNGLGPQRVRDFNQPFDQE